MNIFYQIFWRQNFCTEGTWMPCLNFKDGHNQVHFFKKHLKDINLFCKATDTPKFGLLVMPALGFKARVDPCILACVILRFTTGATPVNCIEVSIAAEAIWPTYTVDFQMCPQASVEVWGSTHDCLCGEHSAVSFGHSSSATIKYILRWNGNPSFLYSNGELSCKVHSVLVQDAWSTRDNKFQDWDPITMYQN